MQLLLIFIRDVYMRERARLSILGRLRLNCWLHLIVFSVGIFWATLASKVSFWPLCVWEWARLTMLLMFYGRRFYWDLYDWSEHSTCSIFGVSYRNASKINPKQIKLFLHIVSFKLEVKFRLKLWFDWHLIYSVV